MDDPALFAPRPAGLAALLALLGRKPTLLTPEQAQVLAAIRFPCR